MRLSVALSVLCGFLLFSLVAGDCSDLANIDGLIFDLDGTIYEPQGLIPGAIKLYQYLLNNNISFVFLSNSGAKGPEGVRAKFSTPPFVISPYPVPLSQIYTAAQGIAHFMLDYIPAGSHVYLLQSTSKFGNTKDSCLKVINRTVSPFLYNSWDLRTDLSIEEAKAWAQRTRNEPGTTFVVTCADGNVGDDADPVTGRPGYTDWSFDLLSKATWLIQNGAILVNHAPDTHNAVFDARYPKTKLATPGPGTFFSLLRSATYPDSTDKLFVTGKGGNMGVKYMMEPAIQLLKAQGASGDRKRIAIVGDTLDTDIAAGNDAEVQTVFVLSGVHTKADLAFYPVKPSCILPSVAPLPQFLARRK